MTAAIRFGPTHEDERIIRAAMREGERATDVIRRALCLLDRELRLAQAREDAYPVKDENLSADADAW